MRSKLWMLVFLSIAAVFAYGLWVDNQTQLSQGLLEVAFYTASLVGVLLSYLSFSRYRQAYWRYVLRIVLALIVWRISFFPIMVLAGFVATWGEYVALTAFGSSSVYPFLLTAVLLMNMAAVWIAELVLHSVLSLLSPSSVSVAPHTSQSSLVLGLPLAVLAVMISFTQPMDWHAIPDTSFIDDKPLPQAGLPEINPYEAALEETGLSLQHKVLFKAAAITYDWIPENTTWSQVVKGTLEKEFVTTEDVSSSFCSKIHYRAFLTAQPFIKQKTVEDIL